MSAEKRILEQTLAKVEHSRDQVLKKVASLERELQRDIVGAIDLRYTDESGLHASEFEFNTEIFSGSIELVPTSGAANRPAEFRPAVFERGPYRVQPIDVFVTRWATLVVVRVAHDEALGRLKLQWYNKDDRASSAVFIVDEEHGDHYYPIASSLTGEVVAGHPRTGIIAFELFRRATSRFSIHFSSIRLGEGADGDVSFSFSCSEQGIDSVLSAPSLRDEVSAILDQEAGRVEAELRKAQSGCVVAALSVLAAAATSGLAGWVLALTAAGGFAFQ